MADGLFDWIKTPEGQGLLGAVAGYASNAQRGAPINSLGRGGLAGLLAYGQGQDRQLKTAEELQQQKLRDLQMQTGNLQLDELRRKTTDDAAAREVLRGIYGQSGMPQSGMPQSGGPTGAVNAALPAELQIGAMPATPAYQAQAQTQAQTGGKGDLFSKYKSVGDQMAAKGLTTQAQQYYDMAEKYRPKFSTTPQQMMVGGRLANVLVSEDGTTKTLNGFEVKPDMVESDLGGKKMWLDKNAVTPGQSFAKSMTPGEAASNALGWANNGLESRKFANTVSQQSAPQFHDGVWVTKPSANAPQGGAVAVPNWAEAKNAPAALAKVTDAKDVLSLLNEADTLLPKATGSWTGLGADTVASSVFGHSTEGAKATSQLKVIQGALVSKMPKMSGPQSDKDVLLYREMAGQIGDPTIPVDQRQAAAATIRKLHEKYAGMSEGSSQPKPPTAAPGGAVPTLRWNPKTRTLEAA